jgi:tetratricopeptide (TPR) repeat protein
VVAVSRKFQTGRQAFLVKDYPAALTNFLGVVQARPDYVFVSGTFREGIWTYVGRAYYGLSRFSEAQQSFERALVPDRNDFLAQIYLGLTVARDNHSAPGLQKIETGLKGLLRWIEHANSVNASAALWDPRAEIRREIEKNLALISSHAADMQKVIEAGEWIGERIENEVEQVRADESRRFNDEY